MSIEDQFHVTDWESVKQFLGMEIARCRACSYHQSMPNKDQGLSKELMATANLLEGYLREIERYTTSKENK